jgi:DNA polymerase I-like protein with 3'-5' exonuclease and polymerase domains
VKDWPFSSIWAADFEFDAKPGERQGVACLVALELRTGQLIRLWQDQLGPQPPYPIGDKDLFIAFYASAEIGCHLSLGWSRPSNVLDLFTEYRNHTNGISRGHGLLDALTHFGLNGIGSLEKKEMRNLVLRGGPYTQQEIVDILDYCESDVRALERLLPAMVPHIDLDRALVRGRFMRTVARIEFSGIPIDIATLQKLRDRWDGIREQLIAEIDKDYGVYEGTTFKLKLFAEYLERHNIPWPKTPTGRLKTSEKVFKQKAAIYPTLAPLRELKASLSELKLNDLCVGDDGRNRTLLSAFRAKTGRNQPSNSRYIFGPACWLRSLIKPPFGYGVAYIDWSQQEFAIAGILSGDAAMMTAYASGDSYLAFAKQTGAVPDDATKKSHSAEREQHKQCMLAVQYGQEADGLAERLGKPRAVAQQLLNAHHRTYRIFWAWSDRVVNHAILHGRIWTRLGWQWRPDKPLNTRSIRNFPMQANGAELLRLACCFADDAGIEICATVHDAVLICAPLERLDADIATMRACMAEASKIILVGHELRTDVATVRWPDRYVDGRGEVMWVRVMQLIGGPGGQT